MPRILTALAFFIYVADLAGQQFDYKDCYAAMTDDTLRIGNSKAEFVFRWNQGKLVPLVFTSKENESFKLQTSSSDQDLFLAGLAKGESTYASFTASKQHSLTADSAYFEVIVHWKSGTTETKRIFHVYPQLPVLSYYYLVKGSASAGSSVNASKKSDLIEDPRLLDKSSDENRLGIVPLTGRHWSITAVRFQDATDHHNSLVQHDSYLSYRKPFFVSGNLLLARNNQTKGSLFVLKESPIAESQRSYSGHDFRVSFDKIEVLGPGVTASDLNVNEWVHSYGAVVGISASDESTLFTLLRQYQKRQRTVREDRDEMILINTWGDRGQDSRMNEQFVLKELELGKKLGATHLQLDDGWQAGISKNSAKKGSRWSEWTKSDWQPHPERFPNGLGPVVKRAKELDMEIGLWFNPGSGNQYRNWKRDADILLSYYRQYGIRTFKIDGVELSDKTSEENLAKLLSYVTQQSSGDIVFNLDVTAGSRPGYHALTAYGNIFLENRYTDWSNYYPHYTLRNLWQLSRYVPAERLQIEFLNKWRNPSKYPNADPLSPKHVPFDYQVAITLMAQPLAWLEASNLPDSAFEISTLLNQYRTIQHDIHKGIILPIGEEPNGFSWTGFQSIHSGKGFILVFREYAEESDKLLETWLPKNSNVELTLIFGKGKSFSGKTDENGRLKFSLPDRHSFALYSYNIESK